MLLNDYSFGLFPSYSRFYYQTLPEPNHAYLKTTQFYMYYFYYTVQDIWLEFYIRLISPFIFIYTLSNFSLLIILMVRDDKFGRQMCSRDEIKRVLASWAERKSETREVWKYLFEGYCIERSEQLYHFSAQPKNSTISRIHIYGKLKQVEYLAPNFLSGPVQLEQLMK